MKFPGSIKVKITDVTGTWFATSLLHKPTPEATVAYLNHLAGKRGIQATYELATEAEYWAYHNQPLEGKKS